MTAPTLTLEERRSRLHDERNAIERQHYTDMLRIREIRAQLAELEDEPAGDW